jgi:hypothetical protein
MGLSDRQACREVANDGLRPFAMAFRVGALIAFLFLGWTLKFLTEKAGRRAGVCADPPGDQPRAA